MIFKAYKRIYVLHDVVEALINVQIPVCMCTGNQFQYHLNIQHLQREMFTI